MKQITRILCASAALFGSLPAVGTQTSAPATYDMVLANGWVIDPEKKLDAIRNVGIKNGTIAAVSATATYERPNQLSAGVKYLLVHGVFVIANHDLQTSASPGQPVRRPVTP